MRSIAFADFLIGLGILFVLEGLMFAASPAWMRRAMKSALATPDNILRAVGIGSAVAGLILIWVVRRCSADPGMTIRNAQENACGINAIVSRRAGFSPYLARAHRHEMSRSMLAPSPRSGALWTSNSRPVFPGERSNMTGAIPALSHRLRPLLAAICLGAASVLMSAPACRRWRAAPRASPMSPRR